MIHNSFGKEITKSPSWLCFLKQLLRSRYQKSLAFFLVQ